MIEVTSDGITTSLEMDGFSQGKIYHDTGLIASPYMKQIAQYMSALEHASTALFIGGGPCILPTFWNERRRGFSTIVEPNEDVLIEAEAVFNFKPQEHKIFKTTGKDYLSAGTKSLYDIIVLDAFNGIKQDEYLYSREGLEGILRLLYDDRSHLIINCVPPSENVGSRRLLYVLSDILRLTNNCLVSCIDKFDANVVLFSVGGKHL
jgi:hypothetical protein